jgi:capsular exopolysaccharide synthesis family protein
MLLGIILGVLYCSLAPPVYESAADVLVVQKRPQAVTGDKQFESGFEDYLAIHRAVIASPLIVQRAIVDSNLGSLQSFADLEDPDEELADAIIEELTVESGSRDLGESADSIMTLSFRSKIPEDCPVVVQALLDSFKSFHDEVWMSDNSVGLISQAREILKNDLAQQEDAYSAFRQSSPLVSKGTDEINPLQDRLTSIELQRSDVLLRRADIEWKLKAIEQAKQDGVDPQQLLAMVTEMRQESTTEKGLTNVSTALENQLIQLVDEEQTLLEHYGPNHPHVLSLRQRIADTRRFLALPSTAHMTDSESGTATESNAAKTDPVALYTQYLQQELKELQISEDLLTSLYDHEHEAAKEHTIFQLKDESFRRGIERTEALYDVVVTRLQEANLIKEFGGFETRVIAPPRLGWQVSPNIAIALPVATFAGLLLGCLLAVAVDLRDDRFQSLGQIQQQLGLPVVGQIPQFAAARKSARGTSASKVALNRMLCAHHGPRSAAAESFRTLRNALYFNSSGESPRVVQISACDREDGGSTVTANLAISLAQTGKRVLLIDADMQKRRMDQMFGITRPEAGLATLVTSDIEPNDVIQQTAVNNLWLLPAGPVPSDACELFTSPRFRELINLVRDSYDHVLIDTEPLLVASDPGVIATHTDGVVLTLRLTRDSRQRARRAKQMLERQDAKILGVVVNRLSSAELKREQMDRRDYAPYVQAEVAPRSRPEQSVSAAK